MKTISRLGLMALLASSGAYSQAEFSFWTDADHLSAFQDTSNMFSSSTNYKVSFAHWGDDIVYIDDLEFIGDTADLTKASGSLEYQEGSEYKTYNFGEAVTGDIQWSFERMAYHYWSSMADLGIHNFTMNILGRTDDGTGISDPTILQTFNFAYDVAGKLDIGVTGNLSKPVIHSGETTALDMTVLNNMDRDFVSTTWFTSAVGNGSGSNLNGDFDWTDTWFNKTIATGQSLTGGHSFWWADSTNPDGVYSGGLGVVGGFYNGDFHFVSMNPAPQITVQSVPGPVPLLFMAIGFLAVGKQKRRK